MISGDAMNCSRGPRRFDHDMGALFEVLVDSRQWTSILLLLLVAPRRAVLNEVGRSLRTQADARC